MNAKQPPQKLPEPPRPDTGFLQLTVGSTMVVGGVRCKVVHINRGRRRISLIPIDASQRMPLEAMADPVQKVTTARA